ncbi:hypothetical protein Y900_019485 [Mycolicibacterium aromaticivorans JS19b1 = JCM 16368]|uniref:Uncharacterized protein n=2 Tax=Mycolicibacterium aromaticivorans TaxID=318425 RepID=A0A064CKD3_9MYCO|nr:hypothetical protein Y900_019485 [Mycolicibacterium aromaticivorans JS19b1 = JCM 16368]
MAATLFAPFALLGIAAVVFDLSQSRRNRRDGVLATWGDLRMTTSLLIVGRGRSAARIPLAGLAATVTETGSSGDPTSHRVRVVIDHIAGESFCREQPYSYGSIGAARTFEILLNRAARPTHTAVETVALRTAA